MAVSNILVVDDFEPLRRLLCSMLGRKPDIQVIGQAADGLEAVQKTQQLQPDLVLLDVEMPFLNGIETARQIRAIAPATKILFVSQELSFDVVQEGFRLGAHGCLLKSDVSGELLRAVDAVLKGEPFVSSRIGPYGVAKWRVSGTYFEACNCEAVCPCRKVGGIKLTAGSTHGVCDFALSWCITSGVFGDVDLSDRFVVMAGSYRDDEPNKPWRIILYIDERSSDEQFAALSNIFLGRAGGTTFRNFGTRIGATYFVRRAAIQLEHSPGRWLMRASKWVEVRASRIAPSERAVSCGVTGYDRPGNELIADKFLVNDERLDTNLRGRCGFETDFDYSNYSSHGVA